MIGYFRTDVPNEENLSIFDGYECIDSDQMKGQGAEDMAVTIENVALITSGLMWPVFQEKDWFYSLKTIGRLNSKQFQHFHL